MHKNLLLVATMMIAACVTEPVESEQASVAFIRAADSWEGGHIKNMIAVWGRPNLLYRDADEKKEGTARWVSGAGFSGRNVRIKCSVTASFDTAGLITNIRARSIPEGAISSCDSRHKADLDQLTRKPNLRTRDVAA